ncbi:Uncharacterised protein [uncultured archaeon]|nr:Uncharacterised protein [uncultured archaeon]
MLTPPLVQPVLKSTSAKFIFVPLIKLWIPAVVFGAYKTLPFHLPKKVSAVTFAVVLILPLPFIIPLKSMFWTNKEVILFIKLPSQEKNPLPIVVIL